MLWLSLVLACSTKPDDKTTDGFDSDGDGFIRTEDCNDGDANVNPDAAEICDGVDQNCNGEIDEDATDFTTWYADADGDGEGDATVTKLTCSQPQGYVTTTGDCNDHDAAVNSTATEVCNGYDDDCDSLVDDDDSGVTGTNTLYRDSDGDLYGAEAVERCKTAEDGYRSIGGDCNDADPTISPGATEVCDGIDSNCDGDSTDAGLVTIAGGETFTSVRGAVLTAVAGDTINVCPGTYEGTFTITDDLSLVGMSTADDTMLVGDTDAPIAAVLGGSASFSNLGFSGGGGADAWGGGISAADADDVTIDGCTFMDNEGAYGGAVYGSEAGTTTITGSTFTANTAGVAGAVYMAGGSVLDSELSGNTGTLAGGMVALSNLGDPITVDLSGTTITGNTATYGGGGGFQGTVDVTGGTFTMNTADYGAGLWAPAFTGTLTDVALTGNTGGSMAGGGAAFDQGGVVSLVDCSIDGNTSEGYGGGLYLSYTALTVDGGSVTSNSSAMTGGGVFVDYYATIDATGADLGEDGTENSPDDVYVATGMLAYSAYGAGATFACDENACTP